MCINHICQNPCSVYGACGHNAICKAINHERICTCAPGYSGNPHTLCTRSKFTDFFPEFPAVSSFSFHFFKLSKIVINNIKI